MLPAKIRFQIHFDKEHLEEANKEVVGGLEAVSEPTMRSSFEEAENVAEKIMEEVRRSPRVSDKWRSVLEHLKSVVEVLRTASLVSRNEYGV